MQLVDFSRFARRHPQLTFLVTPVGEGLAGYSRFELAGVWREVHAVAPLPDNLRFVRTVES